MSEEYIVETSGLTKDFRGFTAVRNVDLQVRRGTIHALIGPNGAGKTTCFNLITKFLQPTAGQHPLQRQRHHGHGTARRRAHGPRALLPDLRRVSSSLGVGECSRRPAARARHRLPFLEPERSVEVLNGRAAELLDDVGVKAYADLPAVELPYGRKRALEIATTLALDPEVLLLDEPMAGMGARISSARRP